LPSLLQAGSAEWCHDVKSVGVGRQHLIGPVVQMLWKRAKSSLNTKVMRLLAAVIAILLAGNGLVFAFVIWPTFTDLENGAAQQNLQRVQEALSKERDDLARVAHDWSAWDPTYAYVVAPNEDYDRQSFTYDVMKDLDLDFIGIYDTKGHRVRSQAFDLETGKETAVAQFTETLPLDHPLLSHAKPDGVAGILLTEHGPMLLASFPILQSTREGPVRGSFLMGRLLDAGMIKDLEHQTHVMFNLFRVDQGELGSAAAAAGALRQGQALVFGSEPHEILASYQLVPTLAGGQPLLLRSETPRRISAIGLTTLAVAGLSTLVTSLLVMAVIWFTLTRLIVTPLNRLTTHVLAVGKTGDLTRRIALDRDDEIGVLSKEFDEAAAQLDNARRRLLEQSYQSGMSEIAAGVIHNIRNALSPTVVTIGHLSEKAAKPPAAHLDAALADLESESTPPERRQMLLQYVVAAVREMEGRGHDIAAALRSVAEQNRHIEQILQDHTALSMGARQLEPVNLAAAVDDAARLVPAQDSTAIDIHVDPQIERMPAILGSSIVVTQILGNLLVNAAEAIRETGEGKGSIHIDAAIERPDERAWVHLTVRDSGAGIEASQISNLFGRGFSTKKTKTGGIGLHWSANSVAAMGGRMYAESEGTGRGASFHIVLPIAASAEEIAA
jgi:two-component system NtrC family sensor kinase